MTFDSYVRALIQQWEEGKRDADDVVLEIREALDEEDEIKGALAEEDEIEGVDPMGPETDRGGLIGQQPY